jgi:hypothetical protein
LDVGGFRTSTGLGEEAGSVPGRVSWFAQEYRKKTNVRDRKYRFDFMTSLSLLQFTRPLLRGLILEIKGKGTGQAGEEQGGGQGRTACIEAEAGHGLVTG